MITDIRRLKAAIYDWRRATGNGLLLITILLLAAPLQAQTYPSAAKIEVRHADQAEYDGIARTITLTGSVHISRDTMAIRADRIQIVLSEDESGVSEASATGHVEITDAGRRGRAERAVYNALTSEITLYGNPRLQDGPSEISAERIIYNIANRSMRAEGGVRGIFVPSKSSVLK